MKSRTEKCRKELYAAAVCFTLALLCAAARQRLGEEAAREQALAARISPQLLRFHVIANSNSAADQKLKLEVKELLLEKLADGLAEEEYGADSPDHTDGASCRSEKSRITRYVADHRDGLEASAADYLTANGCDYGASVRLTRCYFPTKYYGDVMLPRGTYDAVQVTLGSGRGRNWWCLLYPRLCFIDATHAVVPEESKEELACLVGEDDYAALLTQDGVHIRIRFKLFDLLTELTSSPPTE